MCFFYICYMCARLHWDASWVRMHDTECYRRRLIGGLRSRSCGIFTFTFFFWFSVHLYFDMCFLFWHVFWSVLNQFEKKIGKYKWVTKKVGSCCAAWDSWKESDVRLSAWQWPYQRQVSHEREDQATDFTSDSSQKRLPSDSYILVTPPASKFDRKVCNEHHIMVP